jgi:DNA helicase HerA-like ATPase
MPAPGAEDITSRIAQLDGRALAGRRWPLPDFRSIANVPALLRVCGLARRAPDEERQLITQVVVGLHGLGGPFGLVALGTERDFVLGFLHREPTALAGLLRGILPGAEVEVVAPSPEFRGAVAGLRQGAIVVGVPARSASLLDTLAAGMGSRSWGLWVQAIPVSDAHLAASREQVAEEIRLASGALLQRNTIDEDNRLAKLYVELLEGSLKRTAAGCRVGMWQVGVYVLADDAAQLALVSALSRAALGGPQAGPPHLATLRCEGTIESSPTVATCPSLLSSAELAAIVQPPAHETAGFARRRHAEFDVATTATGARARSVALGRIVERGEAGSHWIEVPLADLTRHGLIVGMTGSGKTNTMLYLLQQLWADHQVPFLVIEPVKGAYRALLELPEFADLLVFTPGNDGTSPFRWNPFEVLAGGVVQSHIDHLKSVFAASFVLYPPMPHVLEQSLHEIYQDRGWNLEANSNARGDGDPRAFPTLTDLHEKVGEVVERLGYDTRLTMDVQAGLRARIQSLRIGAKGAMLDVRASFPFAEMMRRPVVIELRQIASDEEKAFIIGLILTQLQEYYDVRARRGEIQTPAPLSHITVLEEAHRLLRSSRAGGGADSADPRQHAVETFTNMLAEIRAYGEGLLVVDQIPEKLAPEVVRNTSLKIVHRLASARDRDLVGEAMLLERAQADFAATLRPGRAAVFMDGADGSWLVEVPEVKAICPAMGCDPADDRVRVLMMRRFGAQAAQLLLPLAVCGQCPHLGKDGLGRVGAVAEASRFRDAIEGFFLAVIDGPGAAQRALEPLIVAARPSLPPLNAAEVVAIVACAFVHEGLRQLEKRARRDGWSFAELARLERDLAQSGAGWRSAAGAPVPAGQGAAPPLATALAELRADFLRRTAREQGPYMGCAGCRQSCRLREIGERFARDDRTIANAARIMSEDGKDGDAHVRLAQWCRFQAAGLAAEASAGLVSDLAQCLAVHLAREADFAWAGEQALVRAVRDMT